MESKGNISENEDAITRSNPFVILTDGQSNMNEHFECYCD